MQAVTPDTTVEYGGLARTVGTNVYRCRVLIVPRKSRDTLARAAGLADETVRKVEDARDPGKPAYNAGLEVVEKLAAGLQRLGVEVTPLELLTRVVVNGDPPVLRSITGGAKGGDPFSQPPLLRPV